MSDLRDRVSRALASKSLTHHGPAGGGTVKRTSARSAFLVVAAMGLGACQTTGLGAPTSGPTDSFTFPELAKAAAQNSGMAVSYVHPDREPHYLEDVNINRVMPGGQSAAGEVTKAHEAKLLLARLGGSPPQALYSSDPRHEITCTGIVGHGPDDPTISRLDAGADIRFENPRTLARFTTLHELAGHCSWFPDKAGTGINHARHKMEVRADGVAAALLAAEQGSVRDVRKVADLRAFQVYRDAATRRAVTDGDNPEFLTSAAYMSAPAIDAVADWAEQRLALPSSDPRHLQQMPAQEIVRAANEIASQHVLSYAQLNRLQRHVEGHRKAHEDLEPGRGMRALGVPDDPAITGLHARLKAAGERLFGARAARRVASTSGMEIGG